MATRFSVSAIFNAVDRMSGPVKKMQMTTKAFSHSVKRDFMSAQRQAEGMTASMGAKMGDVIRMGALAGVGIVLFTAWKRKQILPALPPIALGIILFTLFALLTGLY